MQLKASKLEQSSKCLATRVSLLLIFLPEAAPLVECGASGERLYLFDCNPKGKDLFKESIKMNKSTQLTMFSSKTGEWPPHKIF